MTKPTPLSQKVQRPPADVVEIDAMDVMEWQHGQRTPQASDANLAALVKQSARVHESAPVSVEAARTPSLVARPRAAEPGVRAAGTGVRAPERRGPARPSATQPAVARPSAAQPAVARPGASQPPAQLSVRPGASRPPSQPGSAFPAISTPAPSESLPMAVGGYPIYRAPDASMTPAPVMQTPGPMMMQAPVMPAPAALSPSGLPALYVPDRSDTPAAPSPVVRPSRLERPPSQDPLAISDLSMAPSELRHLREGKRPKLRRVWWLAGAGGFAAAVLGVALAVATEGATPATQPDAPPPSVASETAAPSASAPSAAAAPAPAANIAESKPSVAAIVGPPAAAAPRPASHAAPPARVAAAIPGPARPAPARASHPARRPKKIIVDYQTRADEAPVPGLVAQASEDPAIARARTSYLAGNDKLFAGDPAGAATAYREALGVYPGYVGGYRGLGLAYALLGNTQQAIDALKSYVAAAPGAKDVALIKQRIARLQSK